MTDPYASGPPHGDRPQELTDVCYRHPDRRVSISCQRCERPICGDCMVPASVGFQCPECVKQGHQDTRTGLGRFGGRRSDNPAGTTLALVGLNAVFFVAALLTHGALGVVSFVLALLPLGRCEATQSPGRYYPGILSPSECVASGDGTWVAGVASGAPWQVITSAFLHTSPWHILANMVVLFQLGPVMDAVLGRTRFLTIYLGSALAGSAAVMWFSEPTTSTLGASGAVFGVLGGMVLLARRINLDLRSLGMWLVISLVFSFVASGVSWQGHVGGLIGGLALTAAVLYAPKENRSAWQLGGCALVVVLTLVAIGVRALMLAS